MKTVISAIVIVILMIGAPAVYAETAYQSGFKHGVADGKISIRTAGNGNDYIHQPGKGFAFHTTQFVNGYIHGWCLAHDGGGIDVNDDEIPPTVVSFDCDKGLISAYPYTTDWCLIMDNSEFPVCH